MLKLVVFALILGAVCLQAGDWAPIPAEVWVIRSGPKGAVVLEDRMRFNLTSVEYTYLSIRVAVSRFQLPLGHKPRQMEELRQENEFGRVFWLPTFDPKNGKVEVVLRVEVKAASQQADHWEAFKTFLGWIETACRRQVVLVKEV